MSDKSVQETCLKTDIIFAILFSNVSDADLDTLPLKG